VPVNPHSQLLKEMDLIVNSRSDARIFPNAVGFDRERNLPYGLCKGSLDRIGLQKILITPEMVGQWIAIFIAMDAKTGSAVLSREQKWFCDFVNNFGGSAGAVKTPYDIERILNKWLI
jgi:hypothetical protein